MFKNSVGSLVLVLGVASYVWSCGSSNSGTGATSTGGATATGGTSATATGGTSATTGGASATGGTSATGGAPAAGGSATTGGATSTGGASAAGGATGTPVTTLDEACKKNCALGSGLAGCSTTTAVCEQSCMTTLTNTSNVNPDLGRQYTEMMICVANNPYFSSASGFTCAKPDRALNKWSPVVDLASDSPCNLEICFWNCGDGTLGNFDPWVDIQCACSSVH
jgi:hypothetical protein